jgi:ribosomal protein S18 acetylase RimI-like enzyme
MAGLKLLLDTNILIALEDPKPLEPALAALSQKAQLHGLVLFIDEAAVHDIQRDPDETRRERTLSKLRRFPILEGVAHTTDADLQTRFGSVRNDNDRCDVLMLDSLHLGVVDFLVSEDLELHKRAARAGLSDRVFRIPDALSWIRRTFEPQDFRLPYVVAKKAHQIPLADPIFQSLRDDYIDFDDWFERKCRRQHRDCWVLEIDHQIAGLVIRKDEARAEAQITLAGDRILKICTFKISPNFRGEKLGEHLLKKILWFAQANRYDATYLTAFPKHDFLIALLQSFGFEITKTLHTGELMLERRLHREEEVLLAPSEEPLSKDLAIYPRYYSGPRVGKFVVPIQAQFHVALFPEIGEAAPLPLFPSDKYVVEPGSGVGRTPGNTIRKVYVCRAATRQLKAGDLLLFYLSKSADLTRSQTVTSVGVVERVELASSANDLMRCVGRRSVYSRDALVRMLPTPAHPVVVIDFLLVGHLSTPAPVQTLVNMGAFSGRPPQSIARIRETAFQRVMPLLNVAYA